MTVKDGEENPGSGEGEGEGGDAGDTGDQGDDGEGDAGAGAGGEEGGDAGEGGDDSGEGSAAGDQGEGAGAGGEDKGGEGEGDDKSGKDGEGSEETSGELTDAEKALVKKALPKMQNRFDSLTSLIKQQADELKALKDQVAQKVDVKKGTSLDDYTDEQLEDFAAKNPEVARKVDRILTQRLIDRAMQGSKKETAVEQATMTAYIETCKDYPDMKNTQSRMYTRAREIFTTMNLGSVANGEGQRIAAERAAKELGIKAATAGPAKGKPGSTARKDAAKVALAGKKAPAAGQTNGRLDDLLEKATGTKSNSEEWDEYFREETKQKRLKAKIKQQGE